jgi:RNA polymerase sigma-70 factor (ECF subfamily)
LGVESTGLDDATQDVFVVVYRKLEEFEFRSHIKTWLFSLAWRVSQIYRRKQRSAPPLAMDVEHVPDARSSPHDSAARTEALKIMDSILASLDEERRVVFIMAELEQIAVPEIAHTLGINLNTAYSRLRLARDEFNATVKRLQARDDWRQK